MKIDRPTTNPITLNKFELIQGETYYTEDNREDVYLYGKDSWGNPYLVNLGTGWVSNKLDWYEYFVPCPITLKL